ncbi:hypothetical protein [Pleionea mediterranea]|jgi:hypothetical protein|uniref:YfcL protein n=1 Tax=Pleionea mediterranea TaxID=523701 RepID=A0A316FPN8_9GAMM|nr:hypothetical protein [Pleionea mediterranea]PWK50102.1 hypothetical protein C8D97_107269 [Pleionea mediterranea]
MTDFWTKTETLLREMEADEEYDLFAIGYVIPQVALAHQQFDDVADPAQTVRDYVAHCMTQDNIEQADQRLIQQVLDAALQ